MGVFVSKLLSSSSHDDDWREVMGSDLLNTLPSSQDWHDWLTSLRRLASDLFARRFRLNMLISIHTHKGFIIMSDLKLLFNPERHSSHILFCTFIYLFVKELVITTILYRQNLHWGIIWKNIGKLQLWALRVAKYHHYFLIQYVKGEFKTLWKIIYFNQ